MTLSRVLRSWCSCARSWCSLVTGNCSRSLDRCRPQRNLEPCSPSNSWRNLPIIVIACKKSFTAIVYTSNCSRYKCNRSVLFGRQIYFSSILTALVPQMHSNKWQAQINSYILSWLQKQANTVKSQTADSTALQSAGQEAAKLCHLYWARVKHGILTLCLTTNVHNRPAGKTTST